MPVIGTDLILILAALVVSALCSGLEIAFVSSNKLYVELERKRGTLWARLVSGLLKRPARLIGALLVGNNIALVVYGAVMARILEPWLHGFGLGGGLVMVTQTVLGTLVILVFAEFLPKTLFRLDPNGALGLFAVPLQLLYIVLWAPMMVMTGLGELLLRTFGVRVKPGETVFGRIDLDAFIREMGDGGRREGTMDAEVEYFRNTLELSNTKVRDRMVPRAEIEAVEVDVSIEELHARFVASGMSKLLVYKGSIDNIIGYVHGYELFRKPRSVRAILRAVNFIPGTMPVDELLRMFTKQRSHVAVVVDEFGGTAGMLTIEDAVESIVGDIEDEHDLPDGGDERLGPHLFRLETRAEVRHLREDFDLAIPESEEYDTLAGYILQSTGDLPAEGQVLELGPFRITVTQVSQNRIHEVRLEVTDPERGYLHRP